MNDAPVQRSGSENPTDSDRYRVLSVRRRRLVLQVLANRRHPIELGELATSIARLNARSTGPDGNIASRGADARIAIALHHCDLPMMSSVGLIDYDPASNRIDPLHEPIDLLLSKARRSLGQRPERG